MDGSGISFGRFRNTNLGKIGLSLSPTSFVPVFANFGPHHNLKMCFMMFRSNVSETCTWHIIWMSNNLDLRWGPTCCGASSESKLFCKGHPRSSKFTAREQRVNFLTLPNAVIWIVSFPTFISIALHGIALWRMFYAIRLYVHIQSKDIWNLDALRARRSKYDTSSLTTEYLLHILYNKTLIRFSYNAKLV